MGKYKETYKNLYHGTTVEAANKIIETQKFIPSGPNNWCGTGIYFYDIKSKALWAARRKCYELKKATGVSYQHTCVYTDIVDLPKECILDLRDPKDLRQFTEEVNEILEADNFDIAGDIDPQDKLIILRSLILSYFANKHRKKLIVGMFYQREQSQISELVPKANAWQLAVGIETIYCVKDDTILSEIRGASQ